MKCEWQGKVIPFNTSGGYKSVTVAEFLSILSSNAMSRIGKKKEQKKNTKYKKCLNPISYEFYVDTYICTCIYIYMKECVTENLRMNTHNFNYVSNSNQMKPQ